MLLFLRMYTSLSGSRRTWLVCKVNKDVRQSIARSTVNDTN